MAFHIIIEIVEENDFIASYRFKSGGAQFGFFQIDKRSGEVSLTKQMLGDGKNHVFQRAAVKIIREWKQGNLPISAEWAS